MARKTTKTTNKQDETKAKETGKDTKKETATATADKDETPKKKKGGRKTIELDREQFETLCGMLCTEEEIAGFFKVSVDTVERWCKREYGKKFCEVFKIYAEAGRVSLRRAQFAAAMAGSVPMMIFLGKNYLGQSDKKEQKVEVKDEQRTKLAHILEQLEEGEGNESA